MKQGGANLVGFPDNSSEGLDLELHQWCERTSVSMGDDITVVGVWGDAAKLNTRDSVYAILFNVLSGVMHARYLICAFGKRQCCQCGCQGDVCKR